LPLRGVQGDSCLTAETDTSAPVELRNFGARLGHGLRPAQPVTDVELVLGEEHDRLVGRLGADGGAGPDWIVAAFAAGGGARDEHGREQPAGLARSDADGAFELRLPRATYDLYALAPDSLRVAVRRGCDTRSGPVELALSALELSPWRGVVTAGDGRALSGATLEVRVHLDGTGARGLTWGRVTSTARGAVELRRDPTLAFELLVEREGFASTTVAISPGSTPAHLVLQRPAYLQVVRASAERARLLDAEGRTLLAQGPVSRARDFPLHSGASPVLELPPTASWLELEKADGTSERVPVAPVSGRVLRP
jgi:hypothetical protein